jgi:hypothetical protein
MPPRTGPPEGGTDGPPLRVPATLCIVCVRVCLRRESDLQHVDTNRLFHTPGFYYRPNQLKNMTCLLGNTETRTVYRNFELNNLNVNLGDRSHMLYASYLSYNRFLPPEESRYFAHLATNTLAAAPGNADNEKGAFNIFPLSLTTGEMQQSKSVSSSLGRNFLHRFLFYTALLIYAQVWCPRRRSSWSSSSSRCSQSNGS